MVGASAICLGAAFVFDAVFVFDVFVGAGVPQADVASAAPSTK